MDDLVLALAIHRIGFLRTSDKEKLATGLRSSGELTEFSLDGLRKYLGNPYPRATSFRPGDAVRLAERDAAYLARSGAKCVFIHDRLYPAQLREIYDPPFALFYRGELHDDFGPIIAVVGTRHPTFPALQAAFDLSRDLVGAGIPVVSGMAHGIDAAAHRGAVRANGPTIAVFGCGIDTIYPSAHRKLAESILENGGLLVSEHGVGVEPLPYHFPGRNRIISGLSRSVVVVEAPERSGALITADYALDHGRDLFGHSVGVCGSRDGVRGKTPVADPRRAGTTRLVEDGAMIIRNSGDVLRIWDVAADPALVAPGREPELQFGSEASGGLDAGRALAEQLRAELAARR